jgi:hypothetical protein
MLETILQRIEEGELIQVISNNPLNTYEQLVEDLDIEHIYISLLEDTTSFEIYETLSHALSIRDSYSQLVEERLGFNSAFAISLTELNRREPLAIFLTDISHLDTGTLDDLLRLLKYVQDEKQWYQWARAYRFILLTEEDIYRYPFGMLYDSYTFNLREE